MVYPKFIKLYDDIFLAMNRPSNCGSQQCRCCNFQNVMSHNNYIYGRDPAFSVRAPCYNNVRPGPDIYSKESVTYVNPWMLYERRNYD